MQVNDGYIIEVPGALETILDTPEMQRLRNVAQTGNASHVYPDLTGTRLSHSLGALYFVTRMLTGAPGSIIEAQAAGLTHDVGHGPLSHSLDEALFDLTQRTHEEVSAALVTGETSLLNFLIGLPGGIMDKRYRNNKIKAVRGMKSLPDAITEAGIDAGVISELIHPNGKFVQPYLRQVINNGVVDADKIEYLSRDPVKSGMRDGLFDAEFLFSTISFIEKHGRVYLAFDPKAIDALTHLQTIRGTMYKKTYTHRGVLRVEAMQLEAFKRAISPWREELRGKYFLLDDAELQQFMGTTEDEVAFSLWSAAFDRKRVYGIAWELSSDRMSPWTDERTEHNQIYLKLREAGKESIRTEILQRANAYGAGLLEHEVLVHMRKVCTDDPRRRFEVYFSNNGHLIDAREGLENCSRDVIRLFNAFSEHRVSCYVIVTAAKEYEKVRKAAEDYTKSMK